MTDAINPDHYKRLPAEAIEIIEAAIDGAPSNQDAYLHGQVLKYILRCWDKNGIEDLRKAKWYLDRLVDSLDEWEKQKAADLQSLKDHPFGKPKWKPKIGDWVKVNKPKSVDDFLSAWMPGMDKYDGQIVQVKEIDDDPSTHDDWAYIGKAIVHDEWCFMFDWLESAEAPKQPTEPILNSDIIPEGYRRLGGASVEPRQLGDLRWSVSEKRYVEISVDEIGYANSQNWAACRKVAGEVTGEVKPPDGWRWLDHGEKLFLGDTTIAPDGKPHYPSSLDRKYCESTACMMSRTFIRRNKFNVGEMVVHVDDKERIAYEITEYSYFKCAYVVKYKGGHYMYHWSKLAPYIEETKPTVEVTVEVTGEVKNPIGCPDGWRFLEVGEVICKGDVWLEDGQIHSLGLLMIGQTCQTHWKPIIRRNRFEVGEKVVRVLNEMVYEIIAERPDGTYELKNAVGAKNCLFAIDLAPYEDAK